MIDLVPGQFEMAILQPQIAPNVGNIARLCVATGTSLHLVRPMGFVLSDPKLKRAGLDYWPRLRLTIHDDDDAFLATRDPGRVWLFDSVGDRPLFDTPFVAGDTLCLGSETRGIDPKILSRFSGRVVRIPQIAGERCLNQSTSAGVALYQALRCVRESKPA